MDAVVQGFASHPLAWASGLAALVLGVVLLLGNVDLSQAAAMAGDQPVQPGDGTFRSGTPRSIGDLSGQGPPANNPAGPATQPGIPSGPSPGTHPGHQGVPRQPMPATPTGPQPQPAGQGAPRQPQPQPAAHVSPQGGQPQWGIGGPQYAGPQPAGQGQPGYGGQGQGVQDWTLRGELERLGWDASQFQDDRSAFQALSQQLAQRQQQFDQMQQLAQYGQFYLANMQDFQRGLSMVRGQPQGQGVQGQPAQGVQGQQAPPKDDWWKAPEYDQSWESIVRYDPQTQSFIVPMGHDPAIGVKYGKYKEWQRDTMQKMLQDPIGTLKPGLERLVEEKARSLAQQQVSTYDDNQFAQAYVQSQPWMFQKHPNGQVAVGMDGRPLLTHAGQRFQSYVMHAEQSGVKDVRAQQQWAYGQLERDALNVQLQQMQQFLSNPQAIANYYHQLTAQQQQQQQGQNQGVQGQGQNWQQPFNQTVAPGSFQPVQGQGQQQQQVQSPQDINAAQRQAALNLQGARHISGSGSQGANPPASPNAPRRAIGRSALVGRLTNALQQNGIPVT